MISVVIPLYNKAQSISNTLQCIQNQTYKDYEVVVVNDGSTDGCELIVAEIAKNDNRIRLINKKNGGVSSARNEGIKSAKYDYIAFLDADDYWESTYLEELSKLIIDFPDATIYGIGYGYITNGIKTPDKNNLPDGFRGYLEDIWNGKCDYWTGSSSSSSSSLRKIGLFDERMAYGEDLDVWWRLLLEGKGVFYNKTLAYYVQDAENRAMNKVIPFEKHFPFYIEKYAEYRKNNASFRKYFDEQCIYRLWQYAFEPKYKDDLKRVLNQIDFKQLKKSMKLRFEYPLLYNLYLKIKKYV